MTQIFKDRFFWFITAAIGGALYAHYARPAGLDPDIYGFTQRLVDLLHQMWWGILIGFIAIIGLSYVPRETVMKFFKSEDKGNVGLFRAVAAGLIFDICNHGILMIAVKLYERGVRIGQVVAFLIASPWNSLSLTVILWSLIGWQWTLVFIGLSAVIALVTGWVFDQLERSGKIPSNPNRKSKAKKPQSHGQIWLDGLLQAQMITKWLFLGAVLAALIQAYIPTDILQNYFGPTILGLGLTLVAATIIEVCSEGSVPIASTFFNTVYAPGNGFVFLMSGVATDYTEILAIREATKSWKLALLIPAISVPQIILLGVILNQIGG